MGKGKSDKTCHLQSPICSFLESPSATRIQVSTTQFLGTWTYRVSSNAGGSVLI